MPKDKKNYGSTVVPPRNWLDQHDKDTARKKLPSGTKTLGKFKIDKSKIDRDRPFEDLKQAVAGCSDWLPQDTRKLLHDLVAF